MTNRAAGRVNVPVIERATKLVVVAWACVALAGEVWLVSGWRLLPWVSLGLFVTGFALAILDRRTIAAVLVFTYLFPAVISVVHGRYHPYFSVVWVAAMLGALLPDALRRPWQIPLPWRGPLVCWALTIVASGSIVVVREIDFTSALLTAGNVANTSSGGPPPFIVTWVLHVSLALLLGILWFDWLSGARDLDFHRFIATPLVVSCAVMVAVSVYQAFVDVTFLNATVYGVRGRASGTVLDANVCGAVAALWIGGAVLWARGLSRQRHYYLSGLVAALWLAVWASGSRTALAGATIVTMFSVAGLVAAVKSVSMRLTNARILLASVIAAAIVALFVGLNLTVAGPLERIAVIFPDASPQSLRAFIFELWNRSRYGTAAATIISEFPLFGIGVGSFHVLVGEFVPGGLVGDNAQNWYRHQLAEFGLIGSVGWIAWLVSFAAFVLWRRVPPTVWAGRGSLVAFAAISLVGMPSQDVIAAMTFWTMAFWYSSLVGLPSAASVMTRRSWALVAVVLVIYTIGTADIAASRLRVPVRAQRFGWPYSHGLYPPEPDGAGGQRQWTGRRAVVVLEAEKPWLELTVWVDYRALLADGQGDRVRPALIRPVNVKLWRDGELVQNTRFTTTVPNTTYIRVPDGARRVMIEMWVSRVIHPRDVGAAGTRELGAIVKWNFVDAIPPQTIDKSGF